MMEDFMKRINQQREQKALLIAQREQELREQEQATQEKEEFSPKPIFRQLIEEMCGTKVCEEQKQNMEDTMLDFLKDYTLIESSTKEFDYLLEEFSGELAHIDPIPPGIKEADFDLEEEIRFVENLSYDNSFPRPPEKCNSKNVDTITESPSPSPIPVEDSDSHMEEINLFLASDDSMPSGIENDDNDSEGDIRFLKELLNNDPLPLPEIESSSLIILMIRHLLVLLQNHRMLRFALTGGEIDVFENVKDDDYFPFTFVIRIFLPCLTYPEVSPLLLSTGSEDTIFDPGIST
ncbi:hypothetical protein Tco_0222677 [Tanacetum coccineum]